MLNFLLIYKTVEMIAFDHKLLRLYPNQIIAGIELFCKCDIIYIPSKPNEIIIYHKTYL